MANISGKYYFPVSAKLDRSSVTKLNKELRAMVGDNTVSVKFVPDKASVAKTQASIKSISDAMKQAKRSVDGYNTSWFSMLKSATKYRIASAPFYALTRAINEAKEAIVEFDRAQTEFKKVSDLNGQALDDYTKKLGELGKSVARTRTEMVEAATEFKKSGYSDEDAATLAQVASAYQNVADSELSAGDAASFIISQMKAYNMQASDAAGIIDRVNEVWSKFETSINRVNCWKAKARAMLISSQAIIEI